MERQVVIAGATRTPLVEPGGALSGIPSDRLRNSVISEAVTRAGIDMGDVDEIVIGDIPGCREGEEKAIPGLREFAGVTTSNEVCGSCLMLAAMAVTLRYADVAVVGGIASTSPFYQPNKEAASRRSQENWQAILNPYIESAASLAHELGISRQAAANFANSSYSKALAAARQGKFKFEITPVEVYDSGGSAQPLDADNLLSFVISQTRDGSPFPVDEVLAEIDRNILASSGVVTKPKIKSAPDYVPRLADGAAAVVFMSKERAERLGIEPLAEVVAWRTPETEYYGRALAPVLAVNNLLRAAGLQLGDVDLYEIDEVCSTGTVAIISKLGIDPERVNVHGGSLALGYPLGASAARMLTSLLYTMKDLNVKTGILSTCIGGRDAVSMLLRR